MFKIYKPRRPGTVFEQDSVIGVFTHRTEYLEGLLRARERFLPDVLFYALLKRRAIRDNFNALREKFLRSGKRYWIFIDDDILFLNGTIIHDAVASLVRNQWGGASAYMSHSHNWKAKPYDPSPLKAQAVGWLAGYFMLVDSAVVGEIALPDYPTPNTGHDLVYSLLIQEAGYEIGLSPNYVFHQRKLTPYNPEEGRAFEAWRERRFGSWAGPRLAARLPCAYPDFSDLGKEERLLCELFCGLEAVATLGPARLLAQAGARKVYAVQSPDAAELAAQIASGQVELLESDFPGEQLDGLYVERIADLPAWLPRLKARSLIAGRGWSDEVVRAAVREAVGEPQASGDIWWRLG